MFFRDSHGLVFRAGTRFAKTKGKKIHAMNLWIVESK